jgi:hydrogenase expression/formation protein HypE
MAKTAKIILAHGSGGRLSHELVGKEFVPPWANPILDQLNDSAVFSLSRDGSGPRLAFTTDSYVVKPLFFKGGDIGRLAVCGTVNDLAMVGAEPLYLSTGFVIEEGLALSTVRAVVRSMREAATEAGVHIVTGDTKVVEGGAADGLFVNTAGLGVVPPGVEIGGGRAQVGDVVILSGSIGDHGIAVLSQREGLEFESPVASDVAPLNRLVAAMLAASPNVHVLRDPTRGGLATTLNEIADQSGVAVHVEEGKIPLKDGVLAACEMLGFDPLHVANEGKLVAMVAPQDAQAVLAAMRATRYGEEAAIIGEVATEPAGKVLMKTNIGGTRIVHMLVGEMLPRIC